MPGADRLFSLSLSFLADKRKMISSTLRCRYDKKLGVDWKNKQCYVKSVLAPQQVVTLQVRVGNVETGCHSPEGIASGRKWGS